MIGFSILVSVRRGLISMSTLAIAAFGCASAQIPHGFGAIELGMSAKRFHTITGLTLYPCDGCFDTEGSADFYADSFPALFKAPFDREVTGEGSVVGCTFYQGRLVRVDLGPPGVILDSALAYLESAFGPAASRKDWPNGVSSVYWQDSLTTVELKFVGRVTTATERDGLGHMYRVSFADRALDAQLRRDHENAGFAH